MTAPPPTNAAGEPLDPDRDLVAVAVRGMAVAICWGAALVALVLWGVQALMLGTPASERPVATGPAPALLLGGTLAAMVVAGALAWRRLAPIGSYYRRGGLSLISALTTFVAAIVATPVHYAFGGAGLLAMAAVAAVAAVLVGRRGREAT